MSGEGVHGIDRHTQDHICGAPNGLGTDGLAPSMPITCPECRATRPNHRDGACWLCTHPVWGPLCSACGCLAHYPPWPDVARCAELVRAAAGTPTHDTTEEDGDPINEMVAASYEAYPEQWQHKPCARMHRPGYACILPEGHASAPAPDDAEGKA